MACRRTTSTSPTASRRILIEIETGNYNKRAAAPALYTSQGGADPEEAMRTIIQHWSIITGREMKARRVTPS